MHEVIFFIRDAKVCNKYRGQKAILTYINPPDWCIVIYNIYNILHLSEANHLTAFGRLIANNIIKIL